jgi:hypothetical protein
LARLSLSILFGDLASFEARLWVPYPIPSYEETLSNSAIAQLAEDGLHKVTMQYEDGGKFERWSWGQISIRVPAMTPQDEIKRLLIEKAKQ